MRTTRSSSRPGGVSTRPPGSRPPWKQTPLWQQTPPGSRHPPEQTPARSRHPPLGADTPWEQTAPPEQTPPGGGTPPPVKRITDACKNITLPQLRCGRVKMRSSLKNLTEASSPA